MPVVGYEGRYDVSNVGGVRSLWHKTGRRKRPNFLRPAIHSFGYPYVTLAKNGVAKKIRVYRLVALAFIGPPPTPKHEVAHNDGDPSNSNVANLRWATRKENYSDRYKHGTAPVGDQSYVRKLSAAAVAIIRNRYLGGETQTALAAEYGVHRTTVGYAISGKNWGHVQ